jgi:hypothetical protein
MDTYVKKFGVLGSEDIGKKPPAKFKGKVSVDNKRRKLGIKK